MDQLQPEIQWTLAAFLTAAGGLLITWIRAGGKWAGRKLFDDEKGWIPKLVNSHCEMMDALKTVPISMKTLAEADEIQTNLLKRIKESQSDHDTEVMHKLDAMIEAKICIQQAFHEYLNDNKLQAMEFLRQAAGHLLKAKEL